MRLIARPFLVLLASCVLATGARAVEWRGWNAGLSAAAAAHRPVVVDVYTGWCRWCKQMDRDVYARAEVGRYLADHFVTVKLDAEGDEVVTYQGRSMTARALASSFEVSGYPTTIFLAANGEHLANVPGYIEPARFLLLLRYIGDGAMDRGMKWDDFVKKSDGAK
jgi:thioredoxin-related protein